MSDAEVPDDDPAPEPPGTGPTEPPPADPPPVRMPHRPASPGGLNSVGMNSASGHARGSRPSKAEAAADDCDDYCNWVPCDWTPCNSHLILRLSTLLSIAAMLAPRTGGRGVVLSLLGFYRRRLTRRTPACPSTPSCSAYAVAVVRDLGPRRGLAAAARRVRHCGRPGGPTAGRADRA